jgi:hypothetical protein
MFALVFVVSDVVGIESNLVGVEGAMCPLFANLVLFDPQLLWGTKAEIQL